VTRSAAAAASPALKRKRKGKGKGKAELELIFELKVKHPELPCLSNNGLDHQSVTWA